MELDKNNLIILLQRDANCCLVIINNRYKTTEFAGVGAWSLKVKFL